MQQQVNVSTHKIGGFLDQVFASKEVEVLEPLVTFDTSSDQGVVLFDLLQKHQDLAAKKSSCRKWQNFDVIAVAENIVVPIDRDNPENVWNSVLMNKISSVNKNYPMKTKYARNYTCHFFYDEPRTMKRSRRKFEEAYQKNGNSHAKRPVA